MRKTIILGSLLALFAIGAVAQAHDGSGIDNDDTIQATQTTSTAVDADGDRDGARERHADSRSKVRDGRRERHDETRGSHRERHDEANERRVKNRERHDESREYGRRG